MRIAVGLPNSVPGTGAAVLLEWARRAEAGPFSSLGVVDRVVWECHEPLGVLTAAAAATERIGLATTILIAPLRRAETLAAEAATLHESSGGRFTLGVAIGARHDDYEAAGVPHRGRGERLDEMLEHFRDRWGEQGPPVLVGGGSDRAFARMARAADGYIHGGGPPRAFMRAAVTARAAWHDAERPGRPELWGQGYFALGEEAAEPGRDYMLSYYAFTGPFAERIAEGLLTSPQDVAQFVRGYSEAGCDELVLMPAVSAPDQVDRLATVLEGIAS
jgi:alkanesulfonate monooxygenase SsuD/methylene tetrahydromethanopterin reductase-like flavin-dependent oxidoreductase (luciferase family)